MIDLLHTSRRSAPVPLRRTAKPFITPRTLVMNFILSGWNGYFSGASISITNVPPSYGVPVESGTAQRISHCTGSNTESPLQTHL